MKHIARSLSMTLLSFLPLLASPAAATTFQRVEDTSLTDQARAIVHARVVDVEPSTLGDRPATDYIVEVERVLKGDVPGSTIVVRVPGGFRPDGVGLKIWGAPALTTGENALLFLSPGEDGTFRILHLMLGAFHRRSGLALRDLSEAQEVRPDGVGPATDEVRDFDRFADWISDRAAGILRARDYVVAGGSGPRSAVEAFNLMRWDDGNPIRWFNFDTGQSVAWRVHVGGQPGMGLDASIAAFRVGMDVWNNDNGSNIRYTYAGTTAVATGFSDTDNVNSILFDDPGDSGSEGSFDCGTGGVIAVGGPWFDEATRLHKGKPYHESVEADIITNDGTSCFFEGDSSAAEEVFAHELGHTLGIGHSRTRDALMAAQAHDDGRGARLHADDRAAVAELYGGGGGTSPGNGPKAPNKLVAQSITATSVVLVWKDNAKNETEFRVERKSGRGKFTEIQTLPANTTQVTISGLNPGTVYSFRVRAANASGLSGYSNVIKIRTQAAGGTLAAPEGLTAVARSATQVLLTWRDTSSGEAGFRIERSVTGGSYQELARSAAADATRFLVRGLAPGTTYQFRVWAVGTDGTRSPSSTEVTVTTPTL